MSQHVCSDSMGSHLQLMNEVLLPSLAPACLPVKSGLIELARGIISIKSRSYSAACLTISPPPSPVQSELPLASHQGHASQPRPGSLRQLQLAKVPLQEPELHAGRQHPQSGELCQPSEPGGCAGFDV